MCFFADFKHFVDDGTSCNYYVHGAKYFYMPLSYDEFFVFEQKFYIKTKTYCCIGVPFSKMVRKISSREYKDVKSLYIKSLELSKKPSEGLQLTLF